MPDLKSEYKSLEQRAYEVIKDMILFGTLKPMDRLTEEKMASELGVSRTTVKKAFIRLKGEYLLENGPNQGVQVRLSHIDEALEAYEIREVLEGLACRIATRRLSDEKIDEMVHRFEELKIRHMQVDSEEYVRLNFDLHQMISDCFENRAVSKLIVTLTMQTRSFVSGYPSIFRSLEDSMKEHLDILHALKARKETLAEDFMKRHIRNIREAFVHSFEQQSIQRESV